MAYMNASAVLSDPQAVDSPGVDAIVNAIADPTRRGLLQLVRTDEQTAGTLASHFPSISRPAVSQHLRTLRDAGLVEVRADGNRRLYRARAEALTPLSQFIDEMWGDRLQRLKRAAEEREGAGR